MFYAKAGLKFKPDAVRDFSEYKLPDFKILPSYYRVL